MRDFEPMPSRGRRSRPRFDDDDHPELAIRRHRRPEPEPEPDPDAPATGDRWSTWDLSAAGERGPRPYPDWLVTELAAVDAELGVLKTGKEADVHLIQRAVPGTDRACLLAAKRYRDSDHRLFHRDAGYLEGRRVRRSRETRAMTKRTAFGKQVIAGQWAVAEFTVLCRLWEAGTEARTTAGREARTTAGTEAGGPIVPYPVQLLGTEVLMEFIGDHDSGEAAPRLAQLRPDRDLLDHLWQQLVAAMSLLARHGLAHGDLSPYNLLVHGDRLVLIDLPQVVDVVANPRGADLLARDVRVVCEWFAARGQGGVDPDRLLADLLADAGGQAAAQADQHQHPDQDPDLDRGTVVPLRGRPERSARELPHRRAVLQLDHLAVGGRDRGLGRSDPGRQEVGQVHLHGVLTRGHRDDVTAPHGRDLVAVDEQLDLEQGEGERRPVVSGGHRDLRLPGRCRRAGRLFRRLLRRLGHPDPPEGWVSTQPWDYARSAAVPPPRQVASSLRST